MSDHLNIYELACLQLDRFEELLNENSKKNKEDGEEVAKKYSDIFDQLKKEKRYIIATYCGKIRDLWMHKDADKFYDENFSKIKFLTNSLETLPLLYDHNNKANAIFDQLRKLMDEGRKYYLEINFDRMTFLKKFL